MRFLRQRKNHPKQVGSFFKNNILVGLISSIKGDISCFRKILYTISISYPFNRIRFLEINKLYNVITENLTFSKN